MPKQDRPSPERSIAGGTQPLCRAQLWALRGALLGLAVAVPMMALLVPAQAQRAPKAVAVEDLMKPQALPDIELGAKDAPVTIVEYASVTCPHCADFHKRVFSSLKTKYIDTGKVRFILREFPTAPQPAAIAGFMLGRCVPTDKRYGVIGALFDKQDQWLADGDMYEALFKVARQLGFTQESFEKCLSDQKLMEGVEAVALEGSTTYGVSGTPAFFVNGKSVVAGTLADLDKAIEPILAKK